MLNTRQRLALVFEQQIEAIEAYCQEKGAVLNALKLRDWEGLQAVLTRQQKWAGLLAGAEQQRNALFLTLVGETGARPDYGFYQVIARLPADEHDRLADLYRKLKMGVLRMKSVNQGVDAYVHAMSHTIAGVLDEILPYRKGKMYSGNGKSKKGGDGPVVLDRTI